MDHTSVKQLIFQEKLIAIFRRVPLDQVGDTAKALADGGVRLLEVTFDQQAENCVEQYQNAIASIQQAVGDRICVGAGTVLTVAQVEAAREAGAKFILSPNSCDEVIERTRELGMVSIPGAMTPTEIVHAWDKGADIVKLFPADDLGYHYIWNLKGPLPHIPLLASGGVNPQTIPLFLEKGMDCVATGASIVDRELLAARDYTGIRELAHAHVKAIQEFINGGK